MNDWVIVCLCLGSLICLIIILVFFASRKMRRTWNNNINSLINTVLNGDIDENDILLEGCFKPRGRGLDFHHQGSVVCVLNTKKLRIFIAMHEPHKALQWRKLVYTPLNLIKITAKKVSKNMSRDIKVTIHSKTYIPDTLFLKTIEKDKPIEPIIEMLNTFVIG